MRIPVPSFRQEMPKTEALVERAESGVRGLSREGGVGELHVLRVELMGWGSWFCAGGPHGSMVLGFGLGLGSEGVEVEEEEGSGFGMLIAAAERMGDAVAWAGAAGVV